MVSGHRILKRCALDRFETSYAPEVHCGLGRLSSDASGRERMAPRAEREGTEAGGSMAVGIGIRVANDG